MPLFLGSGLGLVFVLVPLQDRADGLVLLPLAQLAVAGTVPRLLALGTALRCERATICALWILHELLKHFVCVELHESVHVFLGLLAVWGEEVLHLVEGDLLPVASIQNARPQLRDHFHNESVARLDI